jgi:peptide-methionine (R)-S-oxide reductase
VNSCLITKNYVEIKIEMNSNKNKTEEEWRKKLSKLEYHVLREKGTERPFTGEFWDHKEKGIYKCAGCGTELFSSETKFVSGCGWPSYYDAIDKNKIEEKVDRTLRMKRIEVLCKNCGGHLGHVFNDGPRDKTGLRYCINSAALDFEKTE